MLTLAQFAEHTSTLRKSSTIPYTKLVKAPPLLDTNDLEEDFGNASPTSPYSEKYDAKTPEPIAEMVERRKRELFKPAVGLVPEGASIKDEVVTDNDDVKSGGHGEEEEGASKKTVVIDGRRACM